MDVLKLKDLSKLDPISFEHVSNSTLILDYNEFSKIVQKVEKTIYDKKIKEIIDFCYTEDMTEELILNVLAEDTNVIPKILRILGQERKVNKALIKDLNLELSRADVYIEDYCEDKNTNQQINRKFILDKV